MIPKRVSYYSKFFHWNLFYWNWQLFFLQLYNYFYLLITLKLVITFFSDSNAGRFFLILLLTPRIFFWKIILETLKNLLRIKVVMRKKKLSKFLKFGSYLFFCVNKSDNEKTKKIWRVKIRRNFIGFYWFIFSLFFYWKIFNSFQFYSEKSTNK